MTDIGSLNFLWSQTMIAGFSAAGVTHAVISPGSRSTPLALAMLRQTELKCTVAIDERSAAFFALGIAKASRRPVLILATSGTAPANWLPAVIEASQAAIPLILISADRPPALQGCGANQTVNQIDLFGQHVRASHVLGLPEQGFDPAYLRRLTACIYEQSTGLLPGPVHINQPFCEPLLPTGELPPVMVPKSIRMLDVPSNHREGLDLSSVAKAISGRPGFIVCGQLDKSIGFPEAVTDLAQKLNCPVFAEPLSGLRFGLHQLKHLCVHYNRWLGWSDDALPNRPEWIIRIGDYPVTRNLQNLLGKSAEVHALIEPRPRWTDPANNLSHVIRADPAAVCQSLSMLVTAPCPDEWFEQFNQLEQAVSGPAQAWHIPALIDSVDANAIIFVGNSLAIRNFDSDSGKSNKPLFIYANRGASGIDGNIATTCGLAEIHGGAIALIGDLTAQHDIGSLALTQGRNIIVIVINNGGGGIFDYLPQSQLPEYEQGWRTPQAIEFRHAALCFGLSYHRSDNAETFASAIVEAQAMGGAHLIELLIN